MVDTQRFFPLLSRIWNEYASDELRETMLFIGKKLLFESSSNFPITATIGRTTVSIEFDAEKGCLVFIRNGETLGRVETVIAVVTPEDEE